MSVSSHGTIFSAWSVRAIAAGTKTQTRRLDKGRKPYRVGDVLWVKEAWRAVERASDAVDGILFAADDVFRRIENSAIAADRWVEAYDNNKHGDRWRSPIFMPRWASRYMLEVTQVRRQQLQEISEDDARAEGVQGPHLGRWTDMQGRLTPPESEPPRHWAHSFFVAWQDIHGAPPWHTVRDESAQWHANPYVYAYTFQVRR